MRAHQKEMSARSERGGGHKPVETWCRIGGGVAVLRVFEQGLEEIAGLPFVHVREKGPLKDPMRLAVDVFGGKGLVEDGVGRDPAEVCSIDDGKVVVHRTPHIETSFDRKGRHITAHIRYERGLLIHERSRPFYFPLLLWCHDRGMPVVHAGLVACEQDGILLAGMGGAGKSTVALSCLCDGWTFLSDDYVALEERDDKVFAGHSLYCSSHLAPAHLPRFPELRDHALCGRSGEEDKCLIHLGDVFPNRLAGSARIRAVVLPQLKGSGPSRIRPATKPEALLALAPSSMVMLPVSTRGHIERMAQLIESVPCFKLEMGSELRDIPSTLEKVIT